MKSLGVQLRNGEDGSLLANFIVRPSLLNQIKDIQRSDDELRKEIQKLTDGGVSEFRFGEDNILMFKDRVCVTEGNQLRQAIMEEAHSSAYALHLGSTKMYRTIRENYWWPGMKRDVAEFVAKCLVCQQVKAEHQRPAGTLQKGKKLICKPCGVSVGIPDNECQSGRHGDCHRLEGGFES
ncbi:Uncharacterized protein TCM_003876 [Theobroma cacao]|uniref:Integrase zinc-binding domain-containing protein n=1 Tax=Theobroma cacao TaxID=3641 RepID=A0A061DPE6_THECC|nr:Uncharacterized protein TCM_003876 [Theobroma cacao]